MSAAVILVNPKYSHNVAAAIRACSCFEVKRLFWTGSRVAPSTYGRLPREERMKGYAEVNWLHFERPLDLLKDYIPVCVEILESSEPLTTFVHPRSAAYIFGPEDGSIPKSYRHLSHRFVHIPSRHCLNLAAALNVILYDRMTKRYKQGVEHLRSIGEIEKRGEIQIPGWDGE